MSGRSEAIQSSVWAEGVFVGIAAMSSLEDLAMVLCFDWCGWRWNRGGWTGLLGRFVHLIFIQVS